MRILILLFIALLVQVFSTDVAMARRGGGVYGHFEKLHFVSETKIPGGLFLCHMTKKHHAMYLGMSISSKGYVLAENKCDTESYYPLTDEKLAEAKSLGLIPQSVPDTPEITLGQYFSGICFGYWHRSFLYRLYW